MVSLAYFDGLPPLCVGAGGVSLLRAAALRRFRLARRAAFIRASRSSVLILSAMIAVFIQKRSFHLSQHKLIPGDHTGRGSSVVERIIGNDEVGSSILPRGTSFHVRVPAND